MDFFTACKKADLDALEKCLDEGEDIDQEDDEGKTALFVAIDKDDYKLAAFLVGRGSDVNREYTDDIGQDTTPLLSALGSLPLAEDDRMVRLLLDHGADPNHRDSIGDNPFFDELLDGMDPAYKKIALYALDKGVDLRRKNGSGETLAHAAAYHWKINGNKDVICRMAELGADLNLADDKGRSPFFNIVNCVDLGDEDAEFVGYLIGRGADPKAADKDGRTLLFVCRSRRVAELLVSKGLDAGRIDDRGQSPLHVFAQDPCGKAMVEHFLSIGMDSSLRDRDGRTPLDCAKRMKAEIAQRDLDGNEAGSRKRLDEIMLLLQ